MPAETGNVADYDAPEWVVAWAGRQGQLILERIARMNLKNRFTEAGAIQLVADELAATIRSRPQGGVWERRLSEERKSCLTALADQVAAEASSMSGTHLSPILTKGEQEVLRRLAYVQLIQELELELMAAQALCAQRGKDGVKSMATLIGLVAIAGGALAFLIKQKRMKSLAETIRQMEGEVEDTEED